MEGRLNFERTSVKPDASAVQVREMNNKAAENLLAALRKGDDDKAVALAIGLGIENQFGPVDAEFLRGKYGINNSNNDPNKPAPDKLVNFATEAEASAANLPAGTRFTVGPEQRLAVATGVSPGQPTVEDAPEEVKRPRVPLSKEEKEMRNQRNREMLTGLVVGLPDFASRVAGGFSQILQDFVTSTNDSEETVDFLRSLAQKPGSGRMKKEGLLKQADLMELRIARKRNKQAGK